ncbi:hypothetical protein FOWG_18162 [Fusarium oxysporum f. sp. lycopersici MN25]|nr:hypothetical protein FOWG_18162 [Fusarium oxysporum f. sp. lycopersici MN25]
MRDIYNARARISRENLGGYRSTAALIKLFDDKEIPYVAEWAKDVPLLYPDVEAFPRGRQFRQHVQHEPLQAATLPSYGTDLLRYCLQRRIRVDRQGEA